MIKFSMDSAARRTAAEGQQHFQFFLSHNVIAKKNVYFFFVFLGFS